MRSSHHATSSTDAKGGSPQIGPWEVVCRAARRLASGCRSAHFFSRPSIGMRRNRGVSRRKQKARQRERQGNLRACLPLLLGVGIVGVLIHSVLFSPSVEEQAMERLRQGRFKEIAEQVAALAQVPSFSTTLRSSLLSSDAPSPEKTGFDRLAGYTFKLSNDLYDGGTNRAVASSNTVSQIPASILALDNRSVAVQGFMLPLKVKNGKVTEWLLMRDRSMCCFAMVPRMNEWILMRMPDGIKPVLDQPVTCAGTFHVGEIREDGFLVGLYRMDATEVILPK